LELWDWRRRVAAVYAEVRALAPFEGWERWRAGRDALFRDHPQSPVPPNRRESYPGIPVFDYDPAFRVVVEVTPITARTIALPHSSQGHTPAHAFGEARFDVGGGEERLVVYRLDAYGDGVFIPFRDATNGGTTYGGGRYLIDTVKGSDLGGTTTAVILDFNFAYHPSCVHDPSWSCPLAPPENTLATAITAGERLP